MKHFNRRQKNRILQSKQICQVYFKISLWSLGVCVNMYFRTFTQWSSSRDSEFRNQMIPSIRAPGRAGILFPRIAALPRCSKIPILLQIWETASPSSCPVWRANAAPSFFTSLPASGCHPPNVSATIGRKAIPCLLHSSWGLIIKLNFCSDFEHKVLSRYEVESCPRFWS